MLRAPSHDDEYARYTRNVLVGWRRLLAGAVALGALLLLGSTPARAAGHSQAVLSVSAIVIHPCRVEIGGSVGTRAASEHDAPLASVSDCDAAPSARVRRIDAAGAPEPASVQSSAAVLTRGNTIVDIQF